MKEQIFTLEQLKQGQVKTALNNNKKEIKRTENDTNELNGRGYELNSEMLTNSTSKKLIRYFFKTYPTIIEDLKQDPSNQQFINELEKTIAENGDLSKLNLISLTNFYEKTFLRKIPYSIDNEKNIGVFNQIINDAECTREEAVKAKKLLITITKPALDNWYKGKISKENI